MRLRAIGKYVYNKKKFAAIGFFILLGLMGMYVFYSLLFFQANRNKWHPLERMGEKWYYYLSNISSDKEDAGITYIQKHFETLDTKRVNSFDGYDVYICSEEAWEMYDYLLGEGEGFSKTNPNQVMVSRDMAAFHPVGSTMKIRIWNKDSYYGKPEPVKTAECTVAGIIRQDKILFSQSPDSPAFSHRISESMFSEAFNGVDVTQVSQIFLNPGFVLEDESWYRRSSGIFLKADKENVLKIGKEYADNGKIYSVRDILEKNDPVFGSRKYNSMIRKIVLFSAACVIYLVVWFCCVFAANKRDFAYLMYITGQQLERRQKKAVVSHCNRFFAMAFLLIPPAFVISFVAWFLPNELDGFWEMKFFMPLLVLGVQFIVCSIGVLCLKIVNWKYAGKVAEYLENCPTQKLYIDDLSVKENLVLALSVQGYKVKWAEEYVEGALEEREISYCKSRRADMLSHDERVIVNQIRDELLTNKE